MKNPQQSQMERTEAAPKSLDRPKQMSKRTTRRTRGQESRVGKDQTERPGGERPERQRALAGEAATAGLEQPLGEQLVATEAKSTWSRASLPTASAPQSPVRCGVSQSQRLPRVDHWPHPPPLTVLPFQSQHRPLVASWSPVAASEQSRDRSSGSKEGRWLSWASKLPGQNLHQTDSSVQKEPVRRP